MNVEGEVLQYHLPHFLMKRGVGELHNSWEVLVVALDNKMATVQVMF